MTPEEAIPRTAADAHNDLLYENIGRGTFPLWFTAKETAEIAKAYATAFYKEQRCAETETRGMGERAPEWRKLFEEWSK